VAIIIVCESYESLHLSIDSNFAFNGEITCFVGPYLCLYYCFSYLFRPD